MARYVTDVACDFKVLDYGDIDSSKWADYSEHRMFPLSAGYALEAWKLRRYEARMARRFTRCTVTTSNELREFESLGVAQPCAVIPNGVDIDYFNPAQRTAVTARALAFVGRMDYFPNVDAVLRFVNQSWPRIRSAVPGAQLRIVGSNPVKSVTRLAGVPGVVVTGHVPDIRPYLADAAVGIAPLRIARGTQNKVLEMMAMGLPVVTSAEAARGIRACSGEHLLVAADDDAFVRYTLELLRNPDLGKRLAQAGRAQVVSAHSWPASMAMVDEVLQVSPPAPVSCPSPGSCSPVVMST
jgi:sugar transferase (PEP-CTERM/EpsH1 system associated)